MKPFVPPARHTLDRQEEKGDGGGFDEEREEVLATAVRSVLLIGLPSVAISD